MRNLSRILVFLIALSGFSQVEESQFYVAGAIDPKMAVLGPYHGKPQDIGTTFNAEFSVGWQKEFVKGFPMRLSTKVEVHPALNNYVKATWLAVDYWLPDKLLFFNVEGFNMYAGVEILTIFRENPYYDFTDPYNFNKYANSTLMAGANAELQYRFNEYFALGSNINVFQGEDIDYVPDVRWDVMITAYLFLN